MKYHVYSGLAAEKTYQFSRETEWFDKAYADYMRSTELSPMNSYYYNNLARLLQGTKQSPGANWSSLAEKNYLRAISLAPSTAFFRCNLADLYLETGREKQGLKELQTAFALNPDFTARHSHRLFSKYYRSGRRELAAKLVGEILRHRPDDAEANYYMGYLLGERNENAAAKDYLKRALKAKPEHQGAKQLLDRLGE